MAEHGLKALTSTFIQRAARMEKFITLLLCFVLLTAATAGVSAVLTGPNWAFLWESLLLGLLAGWSLAIFRWPAWRSALFLVAVGLLFSLLFAGGLSGKILAVFGELFHLAGQVISSLTFRGIDLSRLGNLIVQVFSSTGVVVGRVYTWVKDLMASQPLFDPVSTGIVWSVVVWLVAAWAGWVVEARKNAMAAVLPALLLNLGTLSYGRYNSASIYLILGVMLVLIAVVQYDQRQQEWEQTLVAYPQHKGREVGNISLVIAVILVVLAAIISSLSLQQIIHWTSGIGRAPAQPESGLAKSLGIQPAATATPDAFTTIRNPGLPRELLIGSGPELSTEYVMSVEVNGLGLLGQHGQLPPLYWRSFTYDIYTSHGWNTSATDQTSVQPNQPIQPDHLPDHLPIQEVVRMVPGQSGIAYAAGEPVSVNVTGQAAWRSSNDLFGIDASSANYEVQSLIPVADENSLRQAGTDYPRWITQRYLALPGEVPARVKELAIQLTATEPTPYDRAHAIEQYLRQTYSYTLDIPHPPANQDLVDYFLFQLRKGYCDYYASAMVVLARAAGIPSRVAIGYASGTYNLNSGRYIVTQADAHSWVEVYFPGIGWVPFEPTAGLPPINRSAQPSSAATPTPVPPIIPPGGAGKAGIGKYLAYFFLAIIVATGFTWGIVDEISLRRLVPQVAAREVYRRIRRYATLIGTPLEGGETPYEFSEVITIRIDNITAEGFAANMGRKMVEGIQSIISQIVQLSYRPVEIEASSGLQIVKQWGTLRWQLRLLWILNRGLRMGHALRKQWARLNRYANAQAE